MLKRTPTNNITKYHLSLLLTLNKFIYTETAKVLLSEVTELETSVQMITSLLKG